MIKYNMLLGKVKVKKVYFSTDAPIKQRKRRPTSRLNKLTPDRYSGVVPSSLFPCVYVDVVTSVLCVCVKAYAVR